MLIIFCIIHYGNQVSAIPISQFFPFGLTNSDAELGDGDDLTASLLFPTPFFFYGKPYNILGVSIEDFNDVIEPIAIMWVASVAHITSPVTVISIT